MQNYRKILLKLFWLFKQTIKNLREFLLVKKSEKSAGG